MPDLFEGDPIPLNRPDDFDIMKWLTTSGPSKGHTYVAVDPIVDKVIKYMKSDLGIKKIGAVVSLMYDHFMGEKRKDRGGMLIQGLLL